MEAPDADGEDGELRDVAFFAVCTCKFDGWQTTFYVAQPIFRGQNR